MTLYSPQVDPASSAQAAGAQNIPGPLRGAWWKYLTGVLMAFVIYGAFFIARGAQGFGGVGDNSRIVFFHVPVAILSFITYVVATVYAVKVLRLPADFDSDGKSAAAMELGFLFCILTTITGSIFSRAVWGAYWNWDPSQTRIVIMLLLFASYVVLRSANAEHPARRARLSAVYTIITLVPAFFLIWIVPRVLASFHPGSVIVKPQNNSPAYNYILLLSFIAFNMLFVWMFQLRCRVHRLLVRRQLAQLGE
jgi:heme exporter protein C